MGRALYREYRPKKLSEVIGQNHITDTLQSALKKGAISHAYLFTGPKGVGKTSIARILAHEINSITYDETETHLDIIEIDAASNRRIDEIRDLRDKVHIAPTSSKYKVYIIDEVHMLTREAFNALLKTLEEPPEHAVFILATTEAHKVPETIISRTQRYSFKPIAEKYAISHLRSIADSEKIVIEDSALDLIANHGMGSFRDSIGMLDQIAGFKKDIITRLDVAELLGIPDGETIKLVLNAVLNGHPASIMDAVTTLRSQGINPAKAAQALISALREAITSSHDVESIVHLMSELLPLTGAQSSYEAVEIALLSTIKNPKITIEKIIEKTEVKPVKNENIISEKAHSKSLSDEEISSDPTTEEQVSDSEQVNSTTIDTGDDNSEISSVKSSTDWNAVLTELKKSHNTLYGVIRMADVVFDDKNIQMTFAFSFHKQQVEQQKNMLHLQKIITQLLGSDHKITLLVKKPIVDRNKKVVKKDSDALKSVSTIFGKAELLES